jgi:hypothetical protein
MLQARRRSQSPSKRAPNLYFSKMLEAKRRKAASFMYKGKKYSRTSKGLYKKGLSPVKKKR